MLPDGEAEKRIAEALQMLSINVFHFDAERRLVKVAVRERRETEGQSDG